MAPTAAEGQEGLIALDRLAQDIATATKNITTFLQRSSDSKETNSYIVVGSCSMPHDARPDFLAAKHFLLEATSRLQQLVLSPTDFHLQTTLDLQRVAYYRWLVNFSVPDHVPQQGSSSYQEVAKAANVPEDELTRFARMAMTGGFFHEPTSGEIAHMHHYQRIFFRGCR